MPEDFKILRDAIEQLVNIDAGYYQIGTNQPKAIMIVPPEPLAHWHPQGIETIIKREAKLQDHGHHGGTRRVYQWEIVLNQWNRSNLDTLRQVRDRILTEFTGAATATYQPQTESTNERCNIYISVQKYLRKK